MRPGLLTLLRNSRAALWAALVSLALFQAAAAHHALEHDADEPGEDCGICIQLDTAKTPVADGGVQSATLRPTSKIDGADRFADAAVAACSSPIRAPPSQLI